MKLKVQNFSSTSNIHIHCVIFILVVSIPRIRLRTKDTKTVKRHKTKSTESFFPHLIRYVIVLLLFYTYICIYISFIIIIPSYFHQIIYVLLFTFFFLSTWKTITNYAIIVG